jgi:hypothetical protein
MFANLVSAVLRNAAKMTLHRKSTVDVTGTALAQSYISARSSDVPETLESAKSATSDLDADASSDSPDDGHRNAGPQYQPETAC